MNRLCWLSVIGLLAACSSTGTGGRAGDASSSTDGTADGSDGTTAADGSDGTDGNDGTDGGDGATGDNCPNSEQFNGEVCNLYCAAASCSDGKVCTLNGTEIGCSEPGTQALGKGCNDDSLCAEGVCVTKEGKSVGKCRAFCATDADCDQPEFACLISYESSAGTVGACDIQPPKCSVFTQDCKGEGEGCYLSGCLVAGETGIGEECNAPNDCKAGSLCVSAKCQEACNPKTGGPKPKCHLKCPNNTATIQGNDDVGICAVEDDLESCDLLAQDCSALTACYYDPGKGGVCDEIGSVAVGEPCDQINDCVPGAVCWANSCKKICKDPGVQGEHKECEEKFSPCGKLTQNAGYCDE